MADLAHVVGQDLQLTSSGDLAVVASSQETQQRILHRLLTSPGTYIWQLPYGAGLPALVGSVISRQQVSAIILTQMNYELGVASLPEPRVTVTTNGVSSVSVAITYVDSTSTNPQILNLLMDT